MEPEGGRVEPKLSLSESGDTLRGHSRIVVAQLSCVEAVWGNRSLFGCFDIFLMHPVAYVTSSYPKCEMIRMPPTFAHDLQTSMFAPRGQRSGLTCHTGARRGNLSSYGGSNHVACNLSGAADELELEVAVDMG